MNDLSKAASQFHAVPQVKLKLICAITALIIFVIDLMLPLGVAGGVPYVLVILFALWSDNKWFSIMLAVICTALTMAGYYFSPEGSELWKVIFNRALAIFAIWTTAILTMMWKYKEEELHAVKNKMEKEKIYIATIQGSQHIVNNLLNELQLVYLEAKKHENFDKDTLALFERMMHEASGLMTSLSEVKDVNEEAILESVYPKGDSGGR